MTVLTRLQKLFYAVMAMLISLPVSGTTIIVDSEGVMRRNDNHAEVSFYGVNYTVPFAHAYRALSSLGIDHKKAIDRDVYHFSRLGLNAFRIHLWDVEISDAEGNLIENDHLDLLDYLIYLHGYLGEFVGCHICSFYLFVFKLVGVCTKAQQYSLKAVWRIRSLCSLAVENLRAARIVCGDTSNRFANRGITPLSHKILYL